MQQTRLKGLTSQELDGLAINTMRTLSIYAAVPGWAACVGPHGRVIGMKTFGASAPLKELQRKFRFEPEHGGSVAMGSPGRD